MIAADLDDQLYGHAKDCADLLAQSGIPNAHMLIRNWIRRGKLLECGRYDGRPVYAMADVYRVELATRRNGKRGRRLTPVGSMTHAMP